MRHMMHTISHLDGLPRTKGKYAAYVGDSQPSDPRELPLPQGLFETSATLQMSPAKYDNDPLSGGVANDASQLNLEDNFQRSRPLLSPSRPYGTDERAVSSPGRHIPQSEQTKPPSEQVRPLPKTINQVIRLTDKVLLLRTQLRHAQETLDHCQAFLRLSTDALSTAFIKAESSTSNKKKKKKKKKRKKKKTPNTGADQPERADSPFARAVESSSSATADRIMPEAKFAIDVLSDERDMPMPYAAPDFSKLLNDYHADYESVQKQQALVNEIVDQLSNLEFHLQEKHKDLRARFHDPDLATKLHSELADLNLPVSQPTSEAGTASDTPTLVAEFFDKRGDVGIFEERLQELEYHYMEGSLEREFFADRGESLEISDEEYRENYEARRKAVEEELQIALTEANDLEARCKAAGLQIDAYRNRKHSNSSLVGSHSAAPTSVTSPQPQIQQIRMQPPLTSSRPSRMPVRISGWLRGVQEHAAESIEAADLLGTPEPLPTPVSETSYVFESRE